MRDLGIVKPGTKLYIPFNTYDSNDPSASVTITDLAVTDIEIYKDDSIVQRASDSGYALIDTDGIDIDGNVGIHEVSVDLADNTTAGFYAAGSTYKVVIASITVDGATVNFVAARFVIGYPDALLNTTIAVYTSTDNFTLTAGSADDDAYNGWLCMGHDVASATQVQMGIVEDYTGSSKTINLKADPGIFTMTAADNISLFPPALQPTVAGSTLDVTATGAAGIDWANVENPTTAVDLSATDIQKTDLNPDQSLVTIGTVNNVAGLVAGSGGISVAAESFIATVVGSQVNTYASTRAEDGVYHQVLPSGADTDGYYQFNIGNTGVPQNVTLIGYFQSQGDTYQVFAWNYTLTTYEQIGTISATNTTTDLARSFEYLTDHVGTGAEAGLVRFRILSTDATLFSADRIFCTYTQAVSGIPNGSTITLTTSVTNQTFSGNNWALDLNGQSISGSYFFGATGFSGTGVIVNGNPITIDKCICQNMTLSAFLNIRQATFAGTTTIVSTTGGADDEVNIVDSNSGVPGTGTPTVDASAVTKTLGMQSRKWGGGCAYIINSFCTLSHETTVGGAVTLTNAGGAAEIRGEITQVVVTSSLTATTNIVITSGGPITVNGTGGTVNIFGLHGGVTDNSSGLVTINDFGVDMVAIKNVTESISIYAGMAQTGTINTITLSAGASSVDGAYDPASVRIVAGTGEGQTRLIFQYTGATKVAVVDRNWKVIPDATSQFVVNGDSGREHVNEGLAQSGAATTITLNTLASSVDDAYVGQICFIRSGTGDDQAKLVTSYDGTTKIATVDSAWGVNPDSTSAYAMLPSSPSMLSSATQAQIDDIPTTAEFEARTPSAAQLAYIVDNAATGLPVTFTTSGGSTTAAVFNLVDGGAGSSTDDQYNSRLLVFTSGTLKGVVTDITDYDGASTTATITAIPFAPTSTHQARLI